jgi:transposase
MHGNNRHIILTETDQELLEAGYKSGKTTNFRQRCHCILLSAQGKSIAQISEILGESRQTIYAWFNRFEEKGYEGLFRAPGGGRPTILKIENKNEVERIKEIVSQHPQQLKQAIPLIEDEFSRSFCKQTLIRFLKKTIGPSSDLEE